MVQSSLAADGFQGAHELRRRQALGPPGVVLRWQGSMLRRSWFPKSVSFTGKGAQKGDEPPTPLPDSGRLVCVACRHLKRVAGEDREETGITQVRAGETDCALGQARKEAVSPRGRAHLGITD